MSKPDKTVHMKRLDALRCRELQVYYDAGGHNYWNGAPKPKGIYFASHCFEEAEGSGTRRWTSGPAASAGLVYKPKRGKGDGYLLVVPLERYSAKQLRLVRERVEQNAETIHGFLERGDRLVALAALLRGTMEIHAVA